ncbi:STAS domain-containing protein (plasmid) [Streptomyces longwoodensis]|uniref:STAS domain-containing protein n=2 Tax=Streptomyces longwoodensis TaxID=68231 RepID=UPI002F9170BF|nr:STAS domain-containing protein [Streptomyces longwoodensis]
MAEGRMTDTAQTAPAGRLAVVATATDGIRVLSLAGELDHDSGETLRQALAATGTEKPRIVLDMRQVTFMDSTGVNILIAAYRTISEAGGWVRLAAPSKTVLRVVQLVGIDHLIACRPTLRGALTP